MADRITRVRTARLPATVVQALADQVSTRRRGEYRVAGEEPLEIRLGTRADEPTTVNVTMRTPGDDFELAVGWCVTEGLLPQPVELHEVKYCVKSPSAGDVGEAQEYNVVSVVVRHVHGVSRRTQVTTSSCGICGTESLDALELRTPTIEPSTGPTVSPDVLVSLPGLLRQGQKTFDETGGTHAAGLFDARGETVVIREDVGRHNAVDKVIGHAAVAGRLPLDDHLLMVSGRVSFEIVQKAAMARISVLAAVSAPTTLAIDAADRMGITLATFVRGDTATIWTHPHRVA
jgi:FdhD protein